jgi:hypothetical protein
MFAIKISAKGKPMPKAVIPAVAHIRARSATVAAAQKKTQASVEQAQDLVLVLPAALQRAEQQKLFEERILVVAASAIKAGAARGLDSFEASFSLFGETFAPETLIGAWMTAAARLRGAGYEPGDLFERARQLYGFTISWAVAAEIDDAED